MVSRAASLLLAILAACSPQAQDLPVAEPTLAAVRIDPHPETLDARLARDTRAFFFAQARLFETGASPAARGPLAGVLQAMGRDDLIETGPDADGELACPQQWVDPAELISQSVSGARAVIFETDKAAPEQVAFLEGITARLAEEGFTTFADAGLSFEPGAMSAARVALITEGPATRDPVQGRVLRAAKSGGLSMIDAGIWWTGPAELAALSAEAQSARRHTALADRAAHAFWRSADMRAIIHTDQDTAARRLARDLRQLTGIRPVVVSFVRCSEASDPPAFLPWHGESEADAETRADIVIAVPRPVFRESRLVLSGQSADTLVRIPAAFLPADQPVLIEARRAGSPDLAVPDDRLLLFPGETLPLRLPPGDYRIEAWTESGALTGPVSVSVS